MSERSFFNLRYAMPGYTFILLNLLINLRFFMYLFLSILPKIELSEIALSLLGVLFGFLTLMSGSAVGFLVSQIWYMLYFFFHYALFPITKKRLSYKVLREELKLRDDAGNLEIAYNYFVHSHKNLGIRTYFNRRWDLMMLFGSTIVAIVLGLISGQLAKDLVLSWDAIPQSMQTYVRWPAYYQLMGGALIVLLIGLVAGYIAVWVQHNRMAILVIKQYMTSNKRDKLPKEYFQNSE